MKSQRDFVFKLDFWSSDHTFSLMNDSPGSEDRSQEGVEPEQ